MHRVAFLLVLITCAVVPSQAQLDRRTAIRLSGGWAFPTSPTDLSDNWRSGPGIVADFEYPVAGGEVSLLGSYHHASFPFDRAGFIAHYDQSAGPSVISSVIGPDASIWGITGGLKINDIARSLYLRTDLGYFSLSRGNVTVTGPDQVNVVQFISKTGTLLDFGAGVDMRLSPRFTLFLEGTYYWAQSNQDEPSGTTIFYSAGGTGVERKNTWIGTARLGVSVSI